MILPVSAALSYCSGTHQVYRLGRGLGGVVAPRLTPQPLLRQGLDGHLVDHVVGQVLKIPAETISGSAGAQDKTMRPVRALEDTNLVQVGQAVGVLAQGLVLASQSVSGRDLAELLQVYDVQGADGDTVGGESEETIT